MFFETRKNLKENILRSLDESNFNFTGYSCGYRFTAEFVARNLLGVHSRALACVICALLRRRRLDLRAEVEQKEIGEPLNLTS